MSTTPSRALRAKPTAVCRVCAASVTLGTESLAELSDKLTTFMNEHHHADGSDIVIDIQDLPED